MDETYLDTLERMLDEATPGPWRLGRSDMTSYDSGSGRVFKNVYGGTPEEARESNGKVLHVLSRVARCVADGDNNAETNAALIAESPRALRWAVGIVRQYLLSLQRQRQRAITTGHDQLAFICETQIKNILAGPQETTNA